MVQTAFENACKLIVEASVPAIIETVDCSVCHLNEILGSRIFDVRPLPVTKPVFDIYNSANAKLLKAKQNQFAANLEELKKRIFMGWQRIG